MHRTFKVNGTSVYESIQILNRLFYNLLGLLFLEGNNLYNHIQNNLFKVYNFFSHILTTKLHFPLKILNCTLQYHACFTAKHSQRNGTRKEQFCCMKKQYLNTPENISSTSISFLRARHTANFFISEF